MTQKEANIHHTSESLSKERRMISKRDCHRSVPQHQYIYKISYFICPFNASKLWIIGWIFWSDSYREHHAYGLYITRQLETTSKWTSR
jgi:hypothetical protein